MPYFLITPDRYKTLEADAIASKQIKSWQHDSDTSGSIETPDVTISYQYDPNSNRLTYEVGARHSLAAHMASDNIIANHITKMLSSIPLSTEEVKARSAVASIAIVPPPAGEIVNKDGVFVNPLTIEEQALLKSSGQDGDVGDWTKTQGEGITDNTSASASASELSTEVKEVNGIKIKAPIPA